MKRITLFIFSFATLLGVPVESDAQTSGALEARVSAIEARLAEIEKTLAGKPGFDHGKMDPVVPSGQTKAPAPKPAPDKMETYVIRDGDSLGGIARKYNVPRQALLEANNMSEGQPIYIGETLVIPSAPAGNAPVPAENQVVHVVQPGDTLTGISRRYGTTISSIKSTNRLNSDIIGTGQKLLIPTKDSTAIQASAKKEDIGTNSAAGPYQYDNPLLKTDETYGYYAVQPGDNLYALARDFFTTLKELQRLNKLGNSTVIHPGDELIVPTSKYNAYHQKMVQN